MCFTKLKLCYNVSIFVDQTKTCHNVIRLSLVLQHYFSFLCSGRNAGNVATTAQAPLIGKEMQHTRAANALMFAVPECSVQGYCTFIPPPTHPARILTYSVAPSVGGYGTHVSCGGVRYSG